MPHQVHGAFSSRHVRLRAFPRAKPSLLFERSFRLAAMHEWAHSRPFFGFRVSALRDATWGKELRRENPIPLDPFGFKLGKPSPGIFNRLMFRTVD